MAKNLVSKEQYIHAAARIVQSEGLGALSIRRLGRELDCNTANLYRFFDGLEELSMFASLSYLNEYLLEVSDLIRKEADPVKKHLAIWDCFCKHAFAHAACYNLLFFSKYQAKLYDVMQEYYTIFEKEDADLGELNVVFHQSDFDYRDYLLLTECVKAGRIDEDDSILLNRAAVNLFKGFFKKVLELELDTSDQDRERFRFMEVLQFIFTPYVHSVPAMRETGSAATSETKP